MLKLSEDLYEPNITKHYCLYFFINLVPPTHCFYWNCPIQGLQIHPNDQIKSNGLSSFLTHHDHSVIWHCWATLSFLQAPLPSMCMAVYQPTQPRPPYLSVLSFLTKQHFFLPSPKRSYVPRLILWFSAFFILIIMKATFLILNPREPLTSPKKIQNKTGLGWTIRRCLKVGDGGGLGQWRKDTEEKEGI